MVGNMVSSHFCLLQFKSTLQPNPQTGFLLTGSQTNFLFVFSYIPRWAQEFAFVTRFQTDFFVLDSKVCMYFFKKLRKDTFLTSL